MSTEPTAAPALVDANELTARIVDRMKRAAENGHLASEAGRENVAACRQSDAETLDWVLGLLESAPRLAAPPAPSPVVPEDGFCGKPDGEDRPCRLDAGHEGGCMPIVSGRFVAASRPVVLTEGERERRLRDALQHLYDLHAAGLFPLPDEHYGAITAAAEALSAPALPVGESGEEREEAARWLEGFASEEEEEARNAEEAHHFGAADEARRNERRYRLAVAALRTPPQPESGERERVAAIVRESWGPQWTRTAEQTAEHILATLRASPGCGLTERDTPEMENIRAWWAAMPDGQKRATLMKHNEAECPCGAGTVPGHPYHWCMPHPAWLRAPPQTAGELAALLDDAVASLTANSNPRAMPVAVGTLRWLASKLRQGVRDGCCGLTHPGGSERRTCGCRGPEDCHAGAAAGESADALEVEWVGPATGRRWKYIFPTTDDPDDDTPPTPRAPAQEDATDV